MRDSNRNVFHRSDPAPASVLASPTDPGALLLWRLTGQTNTTVICSIARLAAGGYRIVVTRAGVEMIGETFGDATAAAARGSQIAQDLLRLGWTLVP